MFLPAPPAAQIKDDVARSFRPLPLLANPHVQTFLGVYLPGPACPAARRHVVRLPDGDGLLLHALGGSAASPFTQRLAVRLLDRGVRAVRRELRGADAAIQEPDRQPLW